MERNYYHVGVYPKNGKALIGVKEYETEDYAVAYELVMQQVLKQYRADEILKVDVWRLMLDRSQELDDYLVKKNVVKAEYTDTI